MPARQLSLLNSKGLNSWRLFAFIVIPMCIVVVYQMTMVDLGDPSHISSMIQLSVRLAVPWLFIAFAASSLVVVFPATFTRWLMRNRRIIGSCFTAGMAWQLLFILWMVIGFWNYYLEEAYSYFDLAEQLPGYIILFAMTLTSFRFGAWAVRMAAWSKKRVLQPAIDGP